MPASAPYAAMARVRCGPSGKLVDSNSSVDGASVAAPTPWTARAAIIPAGECASPTASEATANSVMPRDEGASAAEQVAGARAEQQQAAEGQGVGVLRPRQAGVREPQIGVDARQRR